MDTSPRSSTRKRRIKPLTIAIAVVAVLIVAAGAFIAVAQATDTPQFCGSACHEMAPYHTAWAQGAHKDVACVDCHVDPGVVARAEHKLVALQQLVDHVRGATSFPMAAAPVVPDSRCLRCHQNVKVDVTGFSHAAHAKQGPCIECHADAGHNVTTASLKQAGVLNVAYVRSAAASGTSPGAGKANIPNHVRVTCSRCHDMAATKCRTCHTPGPSHNSRPADCTICHAAGPKFTFAHPSNGANCATCHKAPAAHRSGSCASCHKDAGKTWTFSHPLPGAKCATCHDRPAKHSAGACQTCHSNAGKSWAFSHPSQTANCSSCHAAPSKHYGTNCSACHTAGGVWANAHFDHPAVPRGPHTYKTWPCAKCHPSGPPAYFCTCHGNTTGPND